MNKIVHVVGTGTIGEPLIGLFADFKKYLGIDEITFHKRTPMTTERAKVNHLLQRGAKLAVDSDKVADFEALGHKVDYEAQRGARAGDGRHRLHAGRQREQEDLREALRARAASSRRAASSASASPTRWASTTRRSSPGEDRFLQVVSCNTHNIAALVKTLAEDDDNGSDLEQRPLRLHAPGERRLAGLRLLAGAVRRQARRPAVRHAPRARRVAAPRDARLEDEALLLRDEAEHPVHALALVRPLVREADDEAGRRSSGCGRTAGSRSRRSAPPTRSSPSAATTATTAGSSPRRSSPPRRSRSTATAKSSASASRRRTATRSRPRSSAALWLMEPGFRPAGRLAVLDRFFFREI